jgi:sterol desaturase/sphingolipid hydroxylase (fatty acid hydroxylase superfamily)
VSRANASGWIGQLAIGGTLAALILLERRYPLRSGKPKPDRERLPRNFMLAATTAAVVRFCERPLVQRATRWVDRREAGLLPAIGLPRGLETMAGVVLLDYTLYWWHVLLHRVPFLWRSHVVHHIDPVLDTSTALRFHWLEFLCSVPWRLAQVVLLGIRPDTLVLWQKLTALEVLFHHSNLRLPPRLERHLHRVVVTPRMHGIHHSMRGEERNSNFSSGLTVWDVLHRTLRTGVPQREIRIGVPDFPHPHALGLPHLLTLPLQQHRGSDGPPAEPRGVQSARSDGR